MFICQYASNICYIVLMGNGINPSKLTLVSLTDIIEFWSIISKLVTSVDSVLSTTKVTYLPNSELRYCVHFSTLQSKQWLTESTK